MIKRALNQMSERAVNRRQPRGRRPLLTVTQVEFLEMIIEHRFSQKKPVTYSELLHELEL
jgi:hypothetical protein